MKSLCVFCGASPHIDPSYTLLARDFGALLAQRHINLVYGGAKIGMMGALADSVLSNDGTVTGVMLDSLKTRNVSHSHLTRCLSADSPQQRKQLMFTLSDAFVALPGGLGTLDELSDVLAGLQMGCHNKPCGLLNSGGFFTPLLSFLNAAHIAGFLTSSDLALIHTSEHPESLLSFLTQSFLRNCESDRKEGCPKS